MIAQPTLCPDTAERAETPRRVLFVCTGNTCRSPMAAALLSHLAKKESPVRYEADSAGLFADEGAPMTAHAEQALRTLGVEPPAHRARSVSEADMERADLVVGLTSAHAMQLVMRYPQFATKITAFPFDVTDPFGADAETYVRCAEQLRLGVERAFFGREA